MRKLNVNHTFDSDNRVNHIFGLFQMAGSIGSSLINKSTQEDTNRLNQKQWEKEFDYQIARDKIADARYNEETFYNRQFAENQREYERALQQEIFDREDTSYQRTAEDMSSAGINPLAMQSLNSAGSAVSPTSAPVASSQEGSKVAPQFRAQAYTNFALEGLEPSLEFLNSLDNLHTNGLQRDSIRETINSQKLDNQAKQLNNLILAGENGITFDDDGNPILADDFMSSQSERKQNYSRGEEQLRQDRANANKIERSDAWEDITGVNDSMPDSVKTATAITSTLDNVASGLLPSGEDSKLGKTLAGRLEQIKNPKLASAVNLLSLASSVGKGIFNHTILGRSLQQRNKLWRKVAKPGN